LRHLYTLAKIGEGAEASISFLIEMLKGEAVRIRGIHDDGRSVIVGFGQTSELRGIAAWTLVRIGEKCVPHLVQLLAAGDAEVSELAAISLAQLGKAAIPSLVKELKEGDDTSKVNSLVALRRIAARQPRLVIDHLNAVESALKEPDHRVRLGAVLLVDALGSDGKSLLPYVKQLRDDAESKQVREAAAATASRLGNEVEQGGVWRELSGHQTDVHRVVVDPTGEMLAAMTPHTVRLWWWKSGVAHCELKALLLQDVAFAPDGKALVAVDSSGVLRLWRTSDGLLLKEIETGRRGTSVAFSPCGTMVAVVGDSAPAIWEIASASLIATIPTTEECSIVKYTSDGSGLAGMSNNRVTMWQVSTGSVDKSWQLPDVSCFALSPDDKAMAAADRRGIACWSVDSGEIVHRIDTESSCTTLVFTDAGGGIAAGLQDGRVVILATNNFRVAQSIAAGSAAIADVAFLGNGRCVASCTSGYSDRTVMLWLHVVTEGKQR
jgi:WD40 repeat protein